MTWLILFTTTAPVCAMTIVVPTDRPTIQSAVDAAGAGDVVLVEPGTYPESVRIGRGRDGLTIAAEDEADPPVIVPTARRRDVGVHVDRADDVTLEGLVIRGPFEGVRVTNARGTRLIGLEVEDAGIAIRLQRASLVAIDGLDVDGTRLGQGIRIDRSREVVVTDATIEETRREGVLVRDSPSTSLLSVSVSGAHSRDGIKVTRSRDALLAQCTSSDNERDGIRVQGSGSLTLRDNQADVNGDTGVRVDRSHPFMVVDDLVAGGNHATANGRREMVVTPPRCGRRPCSRPASTTTTTTRPGTSTSTTTATPTSVPTTTATTTSMTTTTGPLASAHWRLYVRIAHTDGGQRDVSVPYRSIEAPLVIGVLPGHLPAFRVGDQVTAEEIAALGGDTLARLLIGARGWVVAHPNEYPDFTGSITLRWAQRAP